MERTELLELTQEKSLTWEEVTHAFNDYPKDLGDIFVHGFENFGNAEDFQQKHGGEIGLVSKRDGHHFVHYKGRKWEPLTSDDYINDLGDNAIEISHEVLEPYEIAEKISSMYEFEDVKNYIDHLEQIKEELDVMDTETEVLILNESEIERCPKTLMSYSEDVHTYYVGVYFTDLD